MRILMALAVCLGLFMAAPALAQDEAGLVRRTEMAERYMRLSIGDDLRPIVESMVEETLAIQPDLTPEQRAWFQTNIPVFYDDFMESLIADIAPRYAAVLTEEELAAGIAFYGSPIGRSLARKQTMLQMDIETDIYGAIMAMQAEIDTKYCATFDCEGLTMVLPSTK
ncbi:DUF2059 domain-containing protein [Brevundimonas sp.]|uniref:DUF2059 domain-containing protein n=1 Tax=Brevundimonas sp. TaxID=1871086 RepID=UPI003AF6471A